MADQEQSQDLAPPPPGFQPFPSRSPFVQRAGTFYIRDDAAGGKTVGAWIGHDQSNAEGFAHGGYLMAFCDFALSTVVMGITLNLSADFLRPARQGSWIEARIVERKRSESLVFADAVIVSADTELLRTSGVFRPFVKRV